jgi:hypothetical protein
MTRETVTTKQALEMSRDEADAIAEVIRSEDSPVGIDAGKTHVIIIQKLLALERRLARIEERLGAR